MSLVPGIQRPALEQLCRRFHVQRLGAFGSATDTARFNDNSDLDFLVEFEEMPPAAYADAYFGLLAALVALYGRPVDLVTAGSLRNPYFAASVHERLIELYAARSTGAPCPRREWSGI